jgi:hypothetical protein
VAHACIARTNIPITANARFIDLPKGIRFFCCDINSYHENNNTCSYLDVETKPFGFPFGRIINDRTTGSTELFNSTNLQNPNPTANLTANTTSSAVIQFVTVTASGNSSSSANSSKSRTGKYAIVGVGVGAPLGLALLGVSYLLIREKKKLRQSAARIRSSEEDKRAWISRIQQQQLYPPYGYAAENHTGYQAPWSYRHRSLNELDATRLGELEATQDILVDGSQIQQQEEAPPLPVK